MGFTGETIVCQSNVFKVKDGNDKLLDSDIVSALVLKFYIPLSFYNLQIQINSLVQLGWLYTQFNFFIESHAPSWESANAVQVYKAAIAIGVSNFVQVRIVIVCTINC